LSTGASVAQAGAVSARLALCEPNRLLDRKSRSGIEAFFELGLPDIGKAGCGRR
jgi:hypothetical protein